MTRKQKKMLRRICLAAVLTIAAALLPLEGLWRFAAFLPPYLIIGNDVLWKAVRNILHGQVFDEMFLMSVATIGAFALGEYPEAAGVMLFYQIGEWFQSLAVGKSRRSIAELMDMRPDHAVVLRDGAETELDPEEVIPGETLILRPGDRIPLDGTVIEGVSSVNTAALTGESLPADVAAGDRVISGCVNLTGVLHVRAESRYAESTVARILELVETASEKKAKSEAFITRFARYYTPCVVIGAVLLAALPPLLAGGIWSEWIRRALIFLMVSCPCALVVSVPLSFFGGIGGASRAGILIKGANHLEMLSKIDTVVFDKTGTLTHGSFTVQRICPVGISEAELLEIAALAECRSTHPVGRSIVAAYGKSVEKSRVGSVTEHAGRGLEITLDGETVYVGSAALIGAAAKDPEWAGTAVHVSRNGAYLGYILVADQVKNDAKDAIGALHAKGITKTVMLTGDSQHAAEAVAAEVGVSECRARLLPGGKVEAVEALLAAGRRVAFVGDGINDAPVLTRSDVGIAMGAMGSDAAIESADIVLMEDKLSKLPAAISIARRTMAIVRQNIVFALSVKGLILLLGALGYAGIWAAVFGDVGVMILAILNSMRAMRKS